MASLDLDNETLGEKHRNYNKLFQEAIANHETVSEFKLTDNDIQNMLQIDLASRNRNVHFIISVFKCSDMLCVSRAIAQSTWLVTDPQYANIINPEYLHTELLPHMCTKASIKLYKRLRHDIRDEARAEQFYLHEKKLTIAVKWLPHCSVTFIENHVEKHLDDINDRTVKRLCEKSFTIFERIFDKSQFYNKHRYAQAVMFLLKADVDKYLDLLEKCEDNRFPKFNDRATHLIMKNSPKRVIDKFDRYVKHIDIATFTKYLKADEILSFLYTQAKKDLYCRQFYSLQKLFNYDTLKYFIRRLPRSEQLNFVKKVFINKEITDIVDEDLKVGTEEYYIKKLSIAVNTPSYVWYRFANFQHAFEEITSLISKGVDTNAKCSMLAVLISCAKHNTEHIQSLLDYYLDKHKNEEYYYKLQFATELLKRTYINQYDENTWNKLNELFKALKLYDESNNSSSNKHNKCQCVESIMIYHIIHNQTIPAVIEKQFTFKTLKEYFIGKLSQEQKEKVFTYLYQSQLRHLENPVTNEQDFNTLIKTMENVLKLIKDWNKQLQDYPLVTEKIKELTKLKKEKSWKDSLSSIYNFNKSWRKYMFEESLILFPSEEVCLNALKHDPRLLERHSKEVETLRTDDAVSLRRLLAKLRVYWPITLARHWTDALLQNLNKTDGHKISVRGLCTVFPQEPLLEFIEKYKPAQAKIDWNKVDDRVLSIQRLLAKNMHLARPQLSPDSILSYAKGDYLQFALPSLLAIFYNLSKLESNIHIPKLLDGPVSVQKHGIRFSFQTLDRKMVNQIFLDRWTASKNVSIRAIIFKFTFELLCNDKDPDNAVVFWELIELFIDNLTFEEDKKIYELLAQVEKIPLHVRGNYLMKSYKFMKKLVLNTNESDRAHYAILSLQLTQHSREIMESLCPNFVVDIIQEYIDKDFFNSVDKYSSSWHGITSIISAYLLCSEDENIQTRKYEQVLIPLMNRAFGMWDRRDRRDGSFFIRHNFQHLLKQLSGDLKNYVVEKNKYIPVKMFTNIRSKLEKSVSVRENYLMLTQWKLTVAFAKLVDKVYADSKDWGSICAIIAPEFGEICLQYLKEDVKSHWPCIYKLYSKALKTILSELPDDENFVVLTSMLSNSDFIQGYLTTVTLSFKSYNNNKDKYNKLWEQILLHPSLEVKMHYNYLNVEQGRYVV